MSLSLIMLVLLITLIIVCGYKLLQRLCLYLIFKEYKNINSWLYKFVDKHTRFIFEFGMGLVGKGKRIK